MTRIEEVEKLLSDWEALLSSQIDKNGSSFRHYKSGVYALKSALDILNRPPNTKLNPKQAKCPGVKDCDMNMVEGGCDDWCNFYPPEG